ncbi:hypothetical protein JW777_09210 [bacterium]|nr:hypothetical protein [bacterium]
MKNVFSWGILIVFLLGAGASHSQKVLRRVRQYVLIDMNASSGLAVGGEVDVYRKNELGFFSQVGRVRVIRYQSGKCAAEIVGESIDLKISTGDFADIPRISETPFSGPAEHRPEELEIRPAGGGPEQAAEEPVPADTNFPSAAEMRQPDDATAVYPVLRIRGNLVLIDASESSGLSTGDEVTVWRRKNEGGDWDVGRVRIRKFHEGQCAAEIVYESLGDRISRNDFIRGEIVPEMPGLGDWTIETAPSAPKPLLRKMAVASAGAGLASIALGVLQFSYAGQAEDDYRRASVQSDADRFHRRSVRLNRSAGLWTGAGAALILTGVAEWVLGTPEKTTASGASFSVTPEAGPRSAGVSLNLHF